MEQIAFEQIIQNRDERLKKLSDSRSAPLLIAEKSLLLKDFENLRKCVKDYLLDCLRTYHKSLTFDDSLNLEELTTNYCQQIIDLPNITAGGAVLPKIEIMASFNELFRSVAGLFNKAVFEEHIEMVAFPITLRLNFGAFFKSSNLIRPFSTTKWHSDIWSGQDAGQGVVHIPIFGDFDFNGIDFALPPKFFYPHFVKALQNYSEAEILTREEDFKKINILLKQERIYITDMFLLHRTKIEAKSLRASISFPFKWKKKVESDVYINPQRDMEYCNFSDWLRFGTSRFVVCSDNLRKQEYPKNTANLTYPARYWFEEKECVY